MTTHTDIEYDNDRTRGKKVMTHPIQDYIDALKNYEQEPTSINLAKLQEAERLKNEFRQRQMTSAAEQVKEKIATQAAGITQEPVTAPKSKEEIELYAIKEELRERYKEYLTEIQLNKDLRAAVAKTVEKKRLLTARIKELRERKKSLSPKSAQP